MAIRRGFVGLAVVSIVVIGIVFLGSVPQATAETLSANPSSAVTVIFSKKLDNHFPKS